MPEVANQTTLVPISSAQNKTVPKNAKTNFSNAVQEAWLSDTEHLAQLVGLGVQITGFRFGYAVVHTDSELLVGAQVGVTLPALSASGSFLEFFDGIDNVSDVLYFSGQLLNGFRQNPLLVAHPEVVSVYVFALKNPASDTVGCLVLASDRAQMLDVNQVASCRVLAQQLVQQLAFYRKVEALKKSEFQLMQLNVELRRFATVAAHDLRSPIRTMGSFAGLLRRKLIHKLNDDELELVDHIRKGAGRLSAMVEGILSLAKSSHEDYSKYTNIDLATVVAEAADLIDPDQHHTIEFQGEQPYLKSSLTVIKQVILNLVSNAVKYHHLPSGNIIVTAHKDETSYSIAVKDDGPGIAESDQHRIFYAFVKGQEVPHVTSSGLGLSLVRSLVDRLDGAVTLDSTLGQGSTFKVNIPLKIS